MNLNKLFLWLLGLFILYMIIEVLRTILGGSLAFESLILGLLITTLGYVASLHAKLSEHLGWHHGRGDLE